MFCLSKPILLIPIVIFWCISLYGVLNERVEKTNNKTCVKEYREPTEWMGYKNGNKHVLTIFFDEKNEKYRIAEMYSLKVLPHQFDTKVDSLNYIYSNYENVVGMVVYNCY